MHAPLLSQRGAAVKAARMAADALGDDLPVFMALYERSLPRWEAFSSLKGKCEI
jgi:hypothetical protein